MKQAMRLLMVAAALLFLSRIASAETTSPEANGFAVLVAKAFERVLPKGSVAMVGPFQLRLKLPNGAHIVNLDNIASYCARVPKNCDRAVPQFVADMLATFGDPDGPPKKSDIRVVVRSRDYVDTAQRGPKRLVTKPYVDDLWLVCVIDHPNGVTLLTTDALAGLAMNLNDAIATGLQNTEAALPPIGTGPGNVRGKRIGSVEGNFYDSSRFLLHDDWASLAKEYHGRLVVAVPATKLIVYADATDSAVVTALAMLVAHAAKKAPRPLSTKLYRWLPQGWEVASP